jgi:hypothetical protein
VATSPEARGKAPRSWTRSTETRQAVRRGRNPHNLIRSVAMWQESLGVDASSSPRTRAGCLYLTPWARIPHSRYLADPARRGAGGDLRQARPPAPARTRGRLGTTVFSGRTGRFRFEGYALSPRALYLPRAPLAAGDSASLYNAAALWQVNPGKCAPRSSAPRRG